MADETNKNGDISGDWMQQIMVLRKQEKWGDMISLLSSVLPTLTTDTEKGIAYFWRGYAYNAKGEYDRAIVNYDKAVELTPNDATTHHNRGYAYNAKGEYDRAIADFDKAIELNSDYAAAYNNRGHAYANKGEYDKAITDWKEAVKLAPHQNPEMVDNLLAGIESAAKIRQQLSEKISTELETAKGFEQRAKEHYEAQQRAGYWVAVLLVVLFAGYLVAFDVLWRNKAGNGIWEILPWITVIFLTSSPIIWAVRILNREKTRHFALRENAYANKLMTLLMFYKPRDKYGEELVNKFFDHHSLRGSPQLVTDLENKPKTDDDAVWQVLNLIRRGGGK